MTNVRGRPLVAVVVPNRDALEAWCRRNGGVCTSWTELVERGSTAVLQSLSQHGIEARFPTLFHIRSVYLHAHRFGEHKSFLTSTGTFFRPRLNAYFRVVIEEMYEKVGISVVTPTTSPLEVPPPRRDSQAHQDEIPVFRAPAAIDIGGTCCKMVFFQPPNAARLPPYCTLERDSVHGVRELFGRNTQFFTPAGTSDPKDDFTGILRFAKFPTVRVPDFVAFLKEQGTFSTKYNKKDIMSFPATGGGAYRYETLIQSSLGIGLRQLPELSCTIKGLNFLLKTCPDEVFSYDWRNETPLKTLDPLSYGEAHWPYLLVNIGSGVSIVKCVTNDGTYERVSGLCCAVTSTLMLCLGVNHTSQATSIAARYRSCSLR